MYTTPKPWKKRGWGGIIVCPSSKRSPPLNPLLQRIVPLSLGAVCWGAVSRTRGEGGRGGQVYPLCAVTVQPEHRYSTKQPLRFTGLLTLCRFLLFFCLSLPPLSSCLSTSFHSLHLLLIFLLHLLVSSSSFFFLSSYFSSHASLHFPLLFLFLPVFLLHLQVSSTYFFLLLCRSHPCLPPLFFLINQPLLPHLFHILLSLFILNLHRQSFYIPYMTIKKRNTNFNHSPLNTLNYGIKKCAYMTLVFL